MGCDISSRAEVKRDGKWQAVGPVFRSALYDRFSEYFSSDRFLRCPEPITRRNYAAFAVLAGVRNSGEITPIAEPRGLPADMAEHSFDEDSELGDHSHSWVTLQELSDYNWGEVVQVTGIVDGDEIKRMLKENDWQPNSYCGGTSDRIISFDEICARISGGLSLSGLSCRMTWGVPVGDIASTLLKETIPQLAKVAASEGVSADEIRVVFGFDS